MVPAKPILFAVDLDAVALNFCPVLGNFSSRNFLFCKHDTIIRLKIITAVVAVGDQSHGVRGCKFIDPGSKGQNLSVPQIKFAPVSINFMSLNLALAVATIA